ncbi:MAG: glutathione S-transferase family protein [Alphaproteobacteria bacterium]
MIDLYGMRSPNVQKILLAMEEFGLDYNFIPVNVWASEQFSTEFRALNPNSKVPVIVDHDAAGGEPVTVFESGAILLYLAEKTGRFLPASGTARYAVLQWLMHQMGGIGPMFGQFTHFKIYAVGDHEYSLTRYQTEVRRLYGVLEDRLAQSAWLGGPNYSIADMAAYPWVRRHEFNDIDLGEHPNVARWLAAIEARPAIARYMARLAEVDRGDTERRNAAQDDDLDRYFLRGRYARP